MLRYGVSLLVSTSDSGLPYATLVVNVIGSLVLGLLTGYSASSAHNWDRDVILFAGVGLCGGFTTFSTFSLEMARLVQNEAYLPTVLYGVGSVAIGLLAVMSGLWLGRYFAS